MTWRQPRIQRQSAARVVGRSALRLEDPPLLTGKGSFLGDLSFLCQQHMWVVRPAMLMERSLRSIPRRRWRRRGSSRCGPRATPRIIRRSVCAGIGTQRANVFRLTPYCSRRWRASEMRYVGEPVDALSFLINAAEKTHWILCLNGFGVFKLGRCSGLGPEVSSPSGHNPATVAGAKGVPVDDSGGR